LFCQKETNGKGNKRARNKKKQTKSRRRKGDRGPTKGQSDTTRKTKQQPQKMQGGRSKPIQKEKNLTPPKERGEGKGNRRKKAGKEKSSQAIDQG